MTTLKDDIEQLSIRWDTRKPKEVNIHYWRRIQLTRYINEFPNHKPKKILDVVVFSLIEIPYTVLDEYIWLRYPHL